MQLERVRWANAELLVRQAKDAMRHLKLTTLKLRLTRINLQRYACAIGGLGHRGDGVRDHSS